MNTLKALALSATVAVASLGGTAHAQFTGDASTLPAAAARYATAQPADTGLSRAQVRAEVEQARRDGTLVTDYVTGRPLFATDAQAARRDAAPGGRTRAEVRAEVDQARRDGTLVVSDITGRPFYGVARPMSARSTGAE